MEDIRSESTISFEDVSMVKATVPDVTAEQTQSYDADDSSSDISNASEETLKATELPEININSGISISKTNTLPFDIYVEETENPTIGKKIKRTRDSSESAKSVSNNSNDGDVIIIEGDSSSDKERTISSEDEKEENNDCISVEDVDASKHVDKVNLLHSYLDNQEPLQLSASKNPRPRSISSNSAYSVYINSRLNKRNISSHPSSSLIASPLSITPSSSPPSLSPTRWLQHISPRLSPQLMSSIPSPRKSPGCSLIEDDAISSTSSLYMEHGQVGTHKFVKRTPSTESISFIKMLGVVANSVGIIGCGTASFGTGFMVGGDCVLTALHVVKMMLGLDKTSDTILYQQMKNEMKTRKGKIVFNYEGEIPIGLEMATFNFKDDVRYIDKKCDVCVLELEGCTFPKSFVEFGDLDDGDVFDLIGYPESKPKQRDVSCMVQNVSKEQVIELSKELRLKFPQYCNAVKDPYFGIHSKNIYLFHCTFMHTGSGSPGVRFNAHGEPVICTILNGGYPIFYWKLSVSDKVMCEDKYRIEYGAKMSSVYKYMMENDKPLAEKIFKKYSFQFP